MASKKPTQTILFNNQSADRFITLTNGDEILIPNKSSITVNSDLVPEELPNWITVKVI